MSTNSLVLQGLVGFIDPNNPLSYLPEMNLMNNGSSSNSTSREQQVRSSGYIVSSPAYVEPALRRTFQNVINPTETEVAIINGPNYLFASGNIKIENAKNNDVTNLTLFKNNVKAVSVWVKILENFNDKQVLYDNSLDIQVSNQSISSLAEVYVNGMLKSDVSTDIMTNTGEWKNFTINLDQTSSNHFLFTNKLRQNPIKSCMFGPVLLYDRNLTEQEIKQNLVFFNSRFPISFFDTSSNQITVSSDRVPVWVWILTAVIGVVFVSVVLFFVFLKKKK